MVTETTAERIARNKIIAGVLFSDNKPIHLNKLNGDWVDAVFLLEPGEVYIYVEHIVGKNKGLREKIPYSEINPNNFTAHLPQKTKVEPESVKNRSSAYHSNRSGGVE